MVYFETYVSIEDGVDTKETVQASTDNSSLLLPPYQNAINQILYFWARFKSNSPMPLLLLNQTE
jgi:hypothetical protein